jgi:hypothetical protein
MPTSGRPPARITTHMVERAAVLLWISRELQALTLLQDVSLIAQHCIGVLRSALQAKMTGAGAARLPALDLGEAAAALESATAPYLRSFSRLFGREAAVFIASGKDVGGFDRMVFNVEAEQAPVRQSQEYQQAPAASSEEYGAEGRGQEAAEGD